MGRPQKCRLIAKTPIVKSFKPAGIPMRNIEQIQIAFDEFEAIRLSDYEQHSHEKSAECMNISRQTFGRIINSAHKKIADAIINGKAVLIEGGNFKHIDEEVSTYE